MHSSSSNPWLRRIVPVTLTLFLGVLAAPALAAPDLSDSYLERGAAAEKAGDFIAAENCYHLALRAKPGSVTARSRLDTLLKKSPLPDLMNLAVGPIHTGNRTFGTLLDLLVQRVEERSNGRLEAALVIEDPDGSLSASRSLTATFNENASLKTVLDFLTQQVSAKYDLQGARLRILSRQALAGRGAPSPAAPGIPVGAVAQTTTPAPAEQPDAAVAVSFIGSNEKPAALNDGTIPANSDQAQGRFSWKPHVGTLEWTEYRFTQPKSVAGCEVYWASSSLQAPKAADRIGLPEYWRVLYQNQEGEWWPVDTEPPPPSLDGWNVCRFSPVKAVALRLMIQLGSLSSAGLHEWKVIPGPAEVPPPPRALDFRLDQVLPVSAAVGYRSFRVNKYSATEERNGGRILLDGQPCERFLYAHASSTVTYAVPAGFARFSAVGIKPSHMPNSSWTYRVMADGIPVFESGLLESYPNHQLPIDVSLPDGCRTLTLVTDAAGNGQGDHSIWAMPKLTRGPAEPPTWTSVDGKSLVAAFIRMEAGSVVVMKDGRETKIPLSRLDATSQEQAKRLAAVAPTPSPVAPATPAAPAAPPTSPPSGTSTASSMAQLRKIAEKVVAINPQGLRLFIDRRVVVQSRLPLPAGVFEIQELSVGGELAKAITDDDVDLLAAGRGAKILALNDVSITRLSGIQPNRGLQKLSINGTAIGDEALTALEGMRELTELSLNGCKINGSGLGVLKSSPKLQVLSLWRNPLADASLPIIGSFKSLTTLSLGYTKVTSPALIHLSGLTKLSRLHLDGLKLEPGALDFLAGTKSLSVLDLNGTDISRSLLPMLGSGAPTQSLWLASSKIDGQPFNDADLAAFAEAPKLQSLILSDTAVTGTGLGTLVKTRGLKTLEIERNSALTDDGLAVIVRAHPGLTMLALGGKITAASMGHLSQLRQLTHLRLNGDSLADNNLAGLPPLRDLTKLEIHAPKATSATAAAIARQPNLTSLAVGGTTFNDDAIPELSKLKSLRELNIGQCAFSPSGLEKLRKALPSCVINR